MSKPLKLFVINNLHVELLDDATENLKEYIKAGKGDEKLRRALWDLSAIIPKAVPDEFPGGGCLMEKLSPLPWKYIREEEKRFNERTGEPVTDVTHVIRDAEGLMVALTSTSRGAENLPLMAMAPSLLDALKQAVAQLIADYEATPLDGRRALIDKLTAEIQKAGG